MDIPMPPDNADERRAEDFDDLQNEIAGRNNGRMRRFGHGDENSPDAKTKRQADRAFRDMLDMRLATDAEYRALYIDLGEKLADAEQSSDARLAALTDKLNATQDAIDDMLSSAARLPGGERVFRFADGSIVDERGNTVDDLEAESIVWSPDAPSAEDYFAAVDQRSALTQELNAWTDYRHDTLGTIRDRYDDRDDPMEVDELSEAMEMIEAQKPKMLDGRPSVEESPSPDNASVPSVFPSIGS